MGPVKPTNKTKSMRKLCQTRWKVCFRCCQMAWDIEKHRVAIPDEARYRAPKKTLILEEYLKGLSKDEIRKLVNEVMEETRQEGEI